MLKYTGIRNLALAGFGKVRSMRLIFRSGLLRFVGRNSLVAVEVFTSARTCFLCSGSEKSSLRGPCNGSGPVTAQDDRRHRLPVPDKSADAGLTANGLSAPGNPAVLFNLVRKFSGEKRKSEIFIEHLKDSALKTSCRRFLLGLENSLNSVAAAVRDFQLPGVGTDEFISEMVFALQTGAKEIYNASAAGGARRSNAVLKAKRACNSAERAYRRAITALREREGNKVSALKIEGVYKGLSDAGDSLDACADAAAEILCK